MNRYVIRLAFGLCAIFLKEIRGAIIQRPMNMATNVSGQTFFNCSINTTEYMTWSYRIDCDTTRGDYLTENNCVLKDSYAEHYKIEKTPSVCNLIVLDAMISLGGCYICTEAAGGNQRMYQAMLVVVDSISTIYPNSSEILPEEDVMILNSISYGGPSIPSQQPPLPPSFYWTPSSDPTQIVTSYPGSPTDTSASSFIVVTATRPNVPPYICNLFFNPPLVVPAGCASNAPIYRTSWETESYIVSYPPENINTSEIMIQCPYNQSVFITCYASGYPIPAYTWFNLTHGGGPYYGDTVKIDRGGIYQCVASNKIRGVTYNISTSVNVSDCFTYDFDDTCGDKCEARTCVSDPGCIAILVIAIYFGLNLLFFAIFIVCYGCSKRGRNKMNDQFPWLIKMLPCMNDEGCKCSVWILYFVLLSIFAAFVVFPVILIMSSCCKKKQKASPPQSERNGRGAGGTQLNTFTTTPGRMSVTPNPPSPLNSSGHFQQDPLNRPYPHSSNQQRQPEFWGNSDHYPQNHRNPRPPPRPSPSPLSTGGVVYAELGVDNQPMSRRPIQPIQDGSNTYADIALA